MIERRTDALARSHVPDVGVATAAGEQGSVAAERHGTHGPTAFELVNQGPAVDSVNCDPAVDEPRGQQSSVRAPGGRTDRAVAARHGFLLAVREPPEVGLVIAGDGQQQTAARLERQARDLRAAMPESTHRHDRLALPAHARIRLTRSRSRSC